MEIEWDCLSAADWDAELPDHACALQQSWQFGGAVAALGRRVHRARLRCGGNSALVQLILRPVFGPLHLAYLPRGPIWQVPPSDDQHRQAMALIRETIPKPGVAILLAVPEQDGTGILPLMTPAHMAELPLGPPKDMRAAMHGKWRNRLVRAESTAVKVKHVVPTPNALEALLKAEAGQQHKNRYRNLPAGFFAAWQAHAPKTMQLYSAMLGREPVAQMLFLDHTPGVTYQIGWSNETGRVLSAHHLVLWQAMQHFAHLGRQRLDLGTLDTVTAPGLARFKLGAGAVHRQLGASGIYLPGLPRLWAGERRGSQPDAMIGD